MKTVLAFIGSESNLISRFQFLCQIMDAEPLLLSNADDADENSASLQKAPLVFISAVAGQKDADVAGMVQVVKYSAPDSGLVVIAEKKVKTESAEFLKKSGASFVLLEDEFLDSCKPEFVASQKLHGEWIPVKANEFKAETTLTVSLYHFMPLNRKFVLFIPAGQVLDPVKAQRLTKAGEVYIKRDESLAFNEYVKNNLDASAAGLVSRCRRQYLTMTYAYKDLVMLLSDQSEGSSFQKGKELMDRCRTLADDFMTGLASVGEAWSVVNNAGFDDLTPVDRAPAIGATAGLISLLSGVGEPTEIFLAALFADIGLLDLNPKFIPLWKSGKLSALSEDERKRYESHPLLSINRILTRKLPLPEKIKQIILNTHERCDQKGFPNRPVLVDKILPEAQLIHLAEIIDMNMKVDFGVEKKSPDEVRKQILEKEKQSLGAFQISFLNQVSMAFN